MTSQSSSIVNNIYIYSCLLRLFIFITAEMRADWEQWIILEDARIVYDSCRYHSMRVFRPREYRMGYLTGRDVMTDKKIEDVIYKVKIRGMDEPDAEDSTTDERDFQMIFESKTAKYVIASPSRLYSECYLELQGIMVLIFMINTRLCDYEGKAKERKLKEVFTNCLELFIMSFNADERQEFLKLFKKYLTGKLFNLHQSDLTKYLDAINTRKIDCPTEDHPDYCERVKVPIGYYTETTEYPLMHVDAEGMLFVPYDIDDPLNGKCASYIDVNGKTREEIEKIKNDLIDPFIKVPPVRPPFRTGGPQYSKRKKSKMLLVVPKPRKEPIE